MQPARLFPALSTASLHPACATWEAGHALSGVGGHNLVPVVSARRTDQPGSCRTVTSLRLSGSRSYPRRTADPGRCVLACCTATGGGRSLELKPVARNLTLLFSRQAFV